MRGSNDIGCSYMDFPVPVYKASLGSTCPKAHQCDVQSERGVEDRTKKIEREAEDIYPEPYSVRSFHKTACPSG